MRLPRLRRAARTLRCARCGGPIASLPSHAQDPRLSQARCPVLDDWAAARWLQVCDAACIGEDWPRLERCLAQDVRLLPRDETAALVGRAAVVANMRKRAEQIRMHDYNAIEVTGSSSGPVGVIECRWQLECAEEPRDGAATGRDVLVLRAAEHGWELVWCAQLPR
jgi:hypothetical protein